MTKDEALEIALEAIQIMSEQGDFSNGVTDPTNTMDEGDRRIGWLADDAIKAIRQALAKPNTVVESSLRQYKLAYDEWQDKTEWVQETVTPKELGMHRADVLRERIFKLEAKLKELEK